MFNWSYSMVETWKTVSDKKLRGFVNLLYYHHPYYRKIMREKKIHPSDIRSSEDLTKFPVIFKKDWLSAKKDFILQPAKKEINKTLSFGQKIRGLITPQSLKKDLQWEFKPVTFFTTSGRTGTPTVSFLTQYDWKLLRDWGIRDGSNAVKELPKKIYQSTFPYAQHLAFWQSYLVSQGIGDAFFFTFGAGRTNLQLKLMEKFKVNIIAGMPTYIKYLSDNATDKKVKSEVKIVVFGGEGAPKAMKNKIKDNFSSIGPEPKIKMTYGLTESKIAMYECEEGSGYHTFPHLHIWEVLDPKTLEPVGEGEPGLLVLSYVDFRGTVFLRYSPGDVTKGGIIYEKCPYCGSEVPRIVGRIERVSDTGKLSGMKVKGELIDFNIFDDLLSEIKGLRQYQVIITKKKKKDPYSPDVLLIKLGFAKGVNNKVSLKKEIIRKFKNYTNITPVLKEESPDDIFDKVMGELKGMRVVDERVKK